MNDFSGRCHFHTFKNLLTKKTILFTCKPYFFYLLLNTYKPYFTGCEIINLHCGKWKISNKYTSVN